MCVPLLYCQDYLVLKAMYFLQFFIRVGLLCIAFAGPARKQKRTAVESSVVEALSRSYEYVIVGSGPGGGTLASRLAQANHSVLLIDAGDDQRSNIDYQVPAFQARVTQDPLLQWNFFVRQFSNDTKAHASNKAVWATPDRGEYVGRNPPTGSTYRGILYPRAGTLGGCFSHHALISVTPQEDDWNNLQAVTGDSSWAPSSMRKYFIKLERNQYLPTSVVGHGYTGYLATEFTPLQLAFQDNMILSWLYAAAAAFNTAFPGIIGGGISSLVQLGNALGKDPNAQGTARDQTPGLYQLPLSTNNHARNGPADLIAATIASGAPLTFLPHTLVTGVIWDQAATTPTAMGVNFLSGQSLYSADPRYTGEKGIPGSVNVTREVIISGGAFNTPQILKLSGVGAADELKRFNIPVKVNLPGVGTNMQDRYESAMSWKTDTNFTVLNGCTFDYESPDPCLDKWQNNKIDRGTYASDGLVAGALIKSSTVNQQTSFPNDIDTFVFGGPVNFYGYFPGWDKVAVEDHKHWSWVSLKAHSRNKAGTVKLRSTDPRDVPEINFHYFDEGSLGADLDRQAVVDGLTFARKIHEALPKNLTTATFTEEQPGPDFDLYQYVSNRAERVIVGKH